MEDTSAQEITFLCKFCGVSGAGVRNRIGCVPVRKYCAVWTESVFVVASETPHLPLHLVKCFP